MVLVAVGFVIGVIVAVAARTEALAVNDVLVLIRIALRGKREVVRSEKPIEPGVTLAKRPTLKARAASLGRLR
jgi:hypothetical protein